MEKKDLNEIQTWRVVMLIIGGLLILPIVLWRDRRRRTNAVGKMDLDQYLMSDMIKRASTRDPDRIRQK